MKHFTSLCLSILSLVVAAPVLAQEGAIHLGAPSQENLPAMCASLSQELREFGHFDAKPTWKRVKIAAGKFSLELPHADAWSDGVKPYKPYTSFDRGDQFALTVDGITATPTENGIHFGRLWVDDLCSRSDLRTERLSVAGNIREYVVSWERGDLKKQGIRWQDASYPVIPFKIGISNALLARAKDVIGLCGEPQEVLLVQRGKRIYTISSTCRPITINHFRIANSIQETK